MKKILIIEDNLEIRENTAEILELANYQVLQARDGKQGAEMAIREMPDLIICDIMMPELDGYGVLHILGKKPETARIPFIFLTAKTEMADLRKGMSLGADDYLTKPFSETDLLNSIEVRLKKSDILKKDYPASAEGLTAFFNDAKHALNLEEFGGVQKSRTLKKKSELFTEGDSPSHLYFLKSGSIKTFKIHPDGKELITNIYKTGDFFGYEAIMENRPYSENAIALDDSELILIPKSDFLALLQGQRDISSTFISMLCKKVAEKEMQLLHLAYNSVRQRTAEALLKMLQLHQGEELLAISRDDLSKMVGTAPESVIRVLSDFKDEGLIDIVNTKIRIVEPARLEQVVRWNVARR